LKAIESFSKDTILNFISNFVLIGSFQLVLLPYLSEKLNNAEFGSILYLLGIINLINSMFAASLSNLRLRTGIKKNSYQNLFNSFYVLSVFIVVPLFCLSNYLSTNSNYLIVFYLILLMLKTYGISYYRLELNYLKIAILSIINAGTILIFLFFFKEIISIDNWYIIILIPELIVAYIIGKKIKVINYGMHFELIGLIKKFDRNKALFIGYLMLIIFGFMEASLSYIDRFVIQYIKGSEQVAQFFIATSFSKFQPLFLNIISGVLLSYLATNSNNLWKNKKGQVISGLIVFCIISITFFYVFNKYYLSIFYPNSNLFSNKLLFFSNVVYCLFGVDIILRSFLIKNVKLKLIIIKEFFILIILLFLLLIFFNKESNLVQFLYVLFTIAILKLIASIYLLNEK
jgi:O-antigen/teichoic acid export membrane protein